jgi:AMMECR1 domain-containing protein
MAHEELKLLAVYAMFGVSTMNDANLERAAQRKLSLSSKSRFGVFVTLRRHENVFNVDRLDETQIHGCLGHWTPNYQSMTPEDIVARVRQLARDVRFKDERRLQYDTDVDEDASAVIEISFMNLPLGEVDAVNAGAFSNKTMGLVVDSGAGKRATYLPGVFPNASWSHISQSLRQKAGLGRTAAARFYAYETNVVAFQAYNVLFSAQSASQLRSDVAFFYLKHYDQFVPYQYDAAAHAAIVDERQAVRNVACIGDVVVLARDYRAAFEGKPILSNLEHYYQKWTKNPDLQTAIFMVRAFNAMGVHASRVQLMASKLYAALASNQLEPQFELGEAVSVLARVSVPRMKVLNAALDVMRNRAERMLHAEPTPLDNVFEMNWQSQSVRSVLQSHLQAMNTNTNTNTKSKSRTSMSAHDAAIKETCMDHVTILFRAFMKTAQRTILRVAALETNYLAVIYEFLVNLEAAIVLFERDPLPEHHAQHDMLGAFHDEIRNQRLRYFSALMKRRGDYGLYYFKGDRRARLDITGHVMSLHI